MRLIRKNGASVNHRYRTGTKILAIILRYIQGGFKMIKTHQLISTALVGAVVLGGAPFIGSQDVSATELRLAHFTSPKHPMDRLFMRPWTKQIAKMSGGKLTVKIFPGGKLGKGRGLSLNAPSMALPISRLACKAIPRRYLSARPWWNCRALLPIRTSWSRRCGPLTSLWLRNISG